MKMFIVIPAYNEEKNIGRVVREVLKYGNVVVVDDASEDGTVEELRKLADNIGCGGGDGGEVDEQEANKLQGTSNKLQINPKIQIPNDGETEGMLHLLGHIVNRGQGAALQTGIDYALRQGAEVVVTMDSDGQHRAGEIERLVEPIERGEADVVLGSRFLPTRIATNRRTNSYELRIDTNRYESSSIPWIKKWLVLKPAILFNNVITGMSLTDAHNGFRAMNRKAAEKIRITQDRMAHATEIVSEIKKQGLRWKEVGVTILYNEFGQGVGGGVRVLKDLAKEKILR